MSLKKRAASVAKTIADSVKKAVVNIHERIWWEQIDDDEGVDEVRIKVVPRYKTSGLSGDGWRVSAQTQFLRKGVVLLEGNYNSISTALQHVNWLQRIMCELDLDDPESGRFTEEGKKRVTEGLGAVLPTECAQPGCAEKPVSVYQLKKRFCRFRQCEQKDDYRDGESTRRAFCPRHLDRGDCNLEDSNKNYTVVSGPGPEDAYKYYQDESPSQTIVVDMASGEAIGVDLDE